ncbi:hypothetical protein RB531_28 [Salmonella enterica subsp. enterica serovar Typhimurium]
MRILHTSDWHLGQNFYSKSRAAEHQAFLDWLLETAQAHQVDAIIVAGDIFDTGSPPSYARELYNRFVVNLQQTGCHLVVLAGNHDSVATLNESRDILAFLNTTVIASAGYAPRLLHRRDGSPGAVLCPIPFCARATLLPVRRDYPAARNSSNFFMRLPIIINSSIRKRANYAANESCRLSRRDI